MMDKRHQSDGAKLNLSLGSVSIKMALEVLSLTDISCGQFYKASTIVIYDSRVVPNLKIPHITALDL